MALEAVEYLVGLVHSRFALYKRRQPNPSPAATAPAPAKPVFPLSDLQIRWLGLKVCPPLPPVSSLSLSVSLWSLALFVCERVCWRLSHVSRFLQAFLEVFTRKQTSFPLLRAGLARVVASPAALDRPLRFQDRNHFILAHGHRHS